jgi:competence protein ComEC
MDTPAPNVCKCPVDRLCGRVAAARMSLGAGRVRMTTRKAPRAVVVVAALLGLTLSAFADDSLRVHFIDVGHGDCIFIQTPDDGIPHNGRAEGLRLLIDAGERKHSHNYPVTYLKKLGLKRGDRIDYVVATHLDADHIDGLPTVYDSFHVLNTIEPGYEYSSGPARAFTTAARKESLEGSRFWRDPVRSGLIAKPGDKLKLGSELEARLLFYDAAPGKVDTRTNASSMVLRIRYGSVSFLFMGDAPKAVEESLLARYGNTLKSTVLKVGHHGSTTASGKAFLKTVSPGYAIVCAGLRHKLPNATIIALLKDTCGAQVWRTDDNDVEEHKTSTTAYGDDNILITTNGKNPRPQVRWNR